MKRLFQKSASFSSVSSVTFWSVFTQISSRYAPLRDRSLSPGGSGQRILVVSQCHLPDLPLFYRFIVFEWSPLISSQFSTVPPLSTLFAMTDPPPHLFSLKTTWFTPPKKKTPDTPPARGILLIGSQIRMEKQWWWCPVPSYFNLCHFLVSQRHSGNRRVRKITNNSSRINGAAKTRYRRVLCILSTKVSCFTKKTYQTDQGVQKREQW